MLDETIFKVNHVGKDGFIWWIGQVAPADVWKGQSNIANYLDSDSSKKNWPERCKVRIIGYHTFRKGELEDKDLPWAHIMIDPAFGSGQGGEGTTSNLAGGETCFGFFLDGDDAQQPVIVGLLHRDRNVKNFPEDEEFAFRPFTGHRKGIPPTKAGSIPNSGPKEAPAPTQSTETTNSTEAPTTNSFEYKNGFWENSLGIGIQDAFNLKLDLKYNFPSMGGDALRIPKENLAHQAFDKNMSFTFVYPSTCNDNFIGQITQVLQDFIGFTNGLQKFATTYIDPVLNKVVDIGNSIKSFAYSIGGIIRSITNSLRGTIIKCVMNLFKKFILATGAANPISNILETIIGQAAKRILNIIFCLFEKLIPTILDLIERLLTDLVDSVFAAPICAIQQWTAEILAKTMSAIDEILDPILSGVEWLTGGIQNVFSILNQASSLASLIYNFIGCDQLKCTTPSKWVSNFGPSEMEADNWNKMINNVDFVAGVNNNLALVQGELSKIEALSSTNYPLDCYSKINNPSSQDDLPSYYPGTILPQCIPPDISVSGIGTGAYLIPVIGNKGAIIAAKIISEGTGYTSPPTLTVIDKSGYGSGAVLLCKVNKEGSISKVIIKTSGSGYCQGDLDIPNPGIDSTNTDLDDLDDGKCLYDDIIIEDDDSKNDPETKNNTSKYILTLKTSRKKVIEGESFTITVKSNRLKKPKRVSYSITGVNRRDINQKLNGILEMEAGTANLNINTVSTDSDDSYSAKILKFTLDDYNGLNKSITVLIGDKKEKDVNSDYLLVSNKESINEGSKFKVKLRTKNLEDNTIVPYKIFATNNSLIENFDTYSSFTVVGNQAEIEINTNRNIITKDEVIKVELDNKEASVSILVNKISKGSETNQEKIVCLNGLEVVKPGIGYQLTDYATDGVNKFKLIISPENGAIFGAEEFSTPICGFNDVPNLTIITLTGNGAEILPVMILSETPSSSINVDNINEINTSGIKISGISSSVVNVVDCI